MDRREILKHLALLPIGGGMIAQETLLGAPPEHVTSSLLTSLEEGKNIYESIGVDTIINCRGTFTILGGSIERPEVIEAMEAASGHFVQYDELAFGIGKRLGELTETDWGMVSAGCAAGLKHFTAACVTGGNPEKLIRIPDLKGLDKTEVIIPRYSRNVYDHAVRNVGVEVVMVETAEELKHAINLKTAMIYLTTGRGSATGQPLSLEVIASIAKPKNIPILVDAAAEDLTIPPVHLARGGTVVAYSGGKAICGPQCAGLLLGDKDLLLSAWQASSPHHGPGRDNKVGKEEMLGMLAAVEAWKSRDHKGEWKRWLSWLGEIAEKVTTIHGISTEVTEPNDLNNHAPVLHIKWDPDVLHITGEELAEELARNRPRVAIGARSKAGTTSVNITPNQMQEGEAQKVADRIFGVLSKKRKPRSQKLSQASVDCNGHWEVHMEFFSSESQHTFYLQQDGNWIEGTYANEFAIQEIVGMVEGNTVKMRSVFRKPGNSISYWFSGKMEKGVLKGDVYMGEYLTATFTAKQKHYQSNRKPISIPGGPPLAT